MGDRIGNNVTNRQFKDMGNGAHVEASVDVGGQAGVTVTTNTSPVSAPAGGSFTAVQVLEDATFSAFAELGASGQSMTGFVVPSGVTLFGRITSYTLTSGKVRAYA